MLLGADNAFTGEIGKGKNQVNRWYRYWVCTKIARDYQKAGRCWVIIGDENYGEDLRANMQQCPRHLELQAVIVRSFASHSWNELEEARVLAFNICECSWLKKFKEDDSISLHDLAH